MPVKQLNHQRQFSNSDLSGRQNGHPLAEKSKVETAEVSIKASPSALNSSHMRQPSIET